MLNEVVIEGYVTGKTWKYSGDTLFRLACYRDPQRPAKRQTENRDEPDYLTVRLPAALLAGLPVRLERGIRYRVHGFLQSREYAETLGTFIAGASGLTRALSVSDDLRSEITRNRVTTEIVAERLSVVEAGSGQRSPRAAADALPENGRAHPRPEADPAPSA